MDLFFADDPLTTAHNRYQGMRDAAFAVTEQIWRDKVPMYADLRLFPIDERAISFSESIWTPCSRNINIDIFPWRAIFNQVRSTPRRFDMAIWDGSLLSGLVVGMASRGKNGPNTNVTVRFLERFPWIDLPLRGHIRGIAFDAVHAYAQILGKSMILLRNPTEGAIPLYEKIGFSLVPTIRGCPYYGRLVEYHHGHEQPAPA